MRSYTSDEVLDPVDSFNIDQFLANQELVHENMEDMNEEEINQHNKEFCKNDNRR